MQLLPIVLAAAFQAAEIPPQSPPAPEQPAAEPPVIKVTCRTQRETGTRVVKKVCRSVDQQRQADLEA